MNKDLSISFEFFPAKDETGQNNLWLSLKKLEQFSPKFFSVTFGAGGGERDKSDFLVKKIKITSILDLYCGSGNLSLELSDGIRKITGIAPTV